VEANTTEPKAIDFFSPHKAAACEVSKSLAETLASTALLIVSWSSQLDYTPAAAVYPLAGRRKFPWRFGLFAFTEKHLFHSNCKSSTGSTLGVLKYQLDFAN
jgi:hypothetical protein